MGALLCAAAYAAAQPDLSAKGICVIDADSAQVLVGRELTSRMYPASTTKIMTALLVLEHCDPDEMVRAPMDIEEVTGSSMHLRPFEKVAVKDLVTALMLRSANDGCVAAAIHVSGSVEAFAALMNSRAKAIGCTGTNFVNPNGLHDPNHYTTPFDMAIIAREAMKNETFREIAKTKSATITRSMNQEDRLMLNRNKYLDSDSTAVGIKTGFTNDAGKCFVGAAERETGDIITVIFNSQDWLKDQIALTEYVYQNFSRITLVPEGTEYSKAKVKNGRQREVALVTDVSYDSMVPGGLASRPTVAEVKSRPLTAPIKKGDVVGSVVMRGQNMADFEIPLRAAEDVEVMPPVAKAMTNPIVWIGAAGLGLCGFSLSRRKRIAQARRPRGRRR